ncbi:MAG TPA: AMP-binding protein [Pirellulales bacterium]|jgi:long-chain acyl-CoA synthetase|nr:AMP-binding protein [Pirellulales bacterium]
MIAPSLTAAVPDTAVELLAQRAALVPRLVATWHQTANGNWAPTTYADFWREVVQARDVLMTLGLKPNERVVIFSRTCRLWQVAEFAVLAARAAVVGVEPHAPPALVDDVLSHAQARWLLVDTPQRLGHLPRQTLAHVDAVVSFEPTGAPGPTGQVLVWDVLCRGESCRPGRLHPPSAADGPTPDDAATLLHTSGTTGRPKPIVYTHRQIMVACRAIAELFGQIEPGDRLLSWLPMAPLFQRMMNLVAFACGAEVFFVEDPSRVIEHAGQVGPAVFVGVPRFYEKLHAGICEQLAALGGWRGRWAESAVRTAAERGRRLRAGAAVPWGLRIRHALADRLVLRKLRRVMGRRLKFMVTGSAPTAPWLVEFFHDLGLPLFEAYGLSENTVPIAANRPDAWRSGSVGQPLAANELRIELDGEILVRGPGVFQGFDDDFARERLTSDGYLRTGDLGSLDADGYLHLRGRKSEMIKTSTGRLIAPGRVEAVYSRSQYLEHVVVVGDARPHLVALVTLCVPAVERWLAEHADDVRSADRDLAGRAEVKALIAGEIELHGAELAPYERIVRFAILPHPLNVADGALTSTFKIRRGRVLENYAEVIDGLYREAAVGRESPLVGVSCEAGDP